MDIVVSGYPLREQFTPPADRFRELSIYLYVEIDTGPFFLFFPTAQPGERGVLGLCVLFLTLISIMVCIGTYIKRDVAVEK